MPTTNGNRKILDMKRWEFCAPAPAATVADAKIAEIQTTIDQIEGV